MEAVVVDDPPWLRGDFHFLSRRDRREDSAPAAASRGRDEEQPGAVMQGSTQI